MRTIRNANKVTTLKLFTYASVIMSLLVSGERGRVPALSPRFSAEAGYSGATAASPSVKSGAGFT